MERRCKKPKPAASEVQKCVLDDVPDDLLRLILLRLDSPLWLVRAACACKRWRRIVDGGHGGRAFLRLASSLHPPVVVGHYHNHYGGGFRFVGTNRFVPSSQTLTRLSLDFFPRGISLPHPFDDRWEVADCHGGLVLLRNARCIFTDSTLVVCDPLSRRYRNIHHPANQTSYNFLTDLQTSLNRSINPRVFLLDGGDDDGNISLSNFRVLYCCSYFDDHVDQYGRRVSKSKVHAFSTADGGGWRLVRQAFDHGRLYHRYRGHVIGRIDRSLYLASQLPGRQTVVRVLDNANTNARLELSEVDLPSRARRIGLDYQAFAVVHGASPDPIASPATVYIVHVIGEDLEVFRRIPSSGEWVLQHSIPRLSEATRGLQGHPEPSRWMWVRQVIDGGTGLAVLKLESLTCDDGSWLFSLDVNTMQLQVVPPDMDSYSINPIIYTLPWPQFMNGALPS